MANFVTNRGKYRVGSINLAATSYELQVMLLTTSFTSDDALNLVDDGTTADPKSYEISVGGYTRQNLASKVVFEDDTNDFAGLDAADVTFTGLAAGATIGWAAVLLYSTSGGTTSDTGMDFLWANTLTATPTNGGDITIQFGSTSAGGVLKLASTS